MCGPCISHGESKCESRASDSGRLRTACKKCNAAKRTCKPHPSWARVIFDAIQLCARLYYTFPCIGLLITAAPSPSGQGTHHTLCIQLSMHIMIVGLDEETRRQLNRMESMLHALCDKDGIIPSTLPGYDAPRAASPTTQSPASATGQMERMHLTDDASEPPRKLGNYA